MVLVFMFVLAVMMDVLTDEDGVKSLPFPASSRTPVRMWLVCGLIRFAEQD